MRMFHVDWDVIADRITITPACPELFGPPDLSRGSDYLDHLHPDDRGSYRDTLATLSPACPTYCAQYRLIDSGRGERAMEERGVGRFDAQGRLHGRAAIVTEQGPRRVPVAAAGCGASAVDGELLRKILDASLNGLYVYDFEQGHNTFINARYTALTGYTLDALNAMTAEAFLALFHPDDQSAVLEHIARMRGAADDSLVEIEYRFRRRDGQWIWCISSDSVFERAADGAVRSIIGTFLDISARKQADEALRDSESRAQAHLTEIEHIYATAPVGLCVLDRQFRFVRLNQHLARINGLPVQAHIGKTVREVIPQLADHFEPLLRGIIATGEPLLDLEVEGETPAQPGVRRAWVESWLPLRDANGAVVGINIVASEVTEQRRAERELAARQALLEAVLDNAAVGIAQVSLDGRFMRFNRRLTEIVGYSRAELAGLRFHDITHPEDLAADLEQAGRLQAGEIANYQMDKRYIGKDGRTIWVKLSGSLVRDAAGAPAYFVAIIDDITASRQSESRARTLAKVVETSGDFIGVAGLDGYGIYVNPAGCALVGLDEGVVPQTLIESYLFPEDLPFVRQTVMPTVLREGRWAGEFRFRHFQTGAAIDVFWDVVRIEEPATGEPEFLATVTRDIREQKANEAALRKANRRKDEFLAVVGHELRNPMAPIRSAVDILMMRQRRQDPHIDRTLEILDRQTKHLGRLLDDLLEISRIERGHLNLHRRPLAIGEITQQAADSVRQLMAERGHHFETELPVPDVLVEGDPVRLTQILLNLLLNAANYTQEGGEIGLATDVQTDEVVIRVSDDGPGLTPDALAGVFAPFARGNAEHGSRPGLGLGLAISKRLAELHGGRLEAESRRPHPGSVFSLHLPRYAGQHERRQPALAAAQPAGTSNSRKVLLVEDNVDVAEAMATLLDLLGYPPELAGSASEALALTADWCPRLALLDVGLPDMDGLELARRLRARYPDQAALRLVAVTGFGHDEARARSIEAGFDEHLAKPVDVATLQGLLEHLD